jgi:DNA-binding beta-propeller fold protein YncE
VGLEPVAVAARSNTEVWVVNHLSDSVSVVAINAATPGLSRVTRTLLTCDEPRDIVFAGPSGARAFITTARRGQNGPVASTGWCFPPSAARAIRSSTARRWWSTTRPGAETGTVTLPATGWRLLGKSTAPKGFRFAGSDPNGPVSRVIVKADQLKVRAGKSSWAARASSLPRTDPTRTRRSAAARQMPPARPGAGVPRWAAADRAARRRRDG